MIGYHGSAALRSVVDLAEIDRVALGETFVREFNGRPYEQNPVEFCAAAVRARDASSLFCSELAGECDHWFGWLDERAEANKLVPADYQDDRHMRLIGAYMLPEIILKG
ncbi:MAG: hypothetical protein WC371_05380 [Parachlamydiales bacterium]